MLRGISGLSKQQRKEVEEIVAAAVQKMKDELASSDVEAIGFKYEPVSNFDE